MAMAEWPKDVKSVRLVMSLGATLTIDDINWAKPYVSADVVFEGVPDAKSVDKAWDWLWDKQIAPQADELIALIKERIEVLPATGPPPTRAAVPEAPPGQSYD